MEELFLRLAKISLAASMFILAILMLRLIFNNAPKWILRLCWLPDRLPKRSRLRLTKIPKTIQPQMFRTQMYPLCSPRKLSPPLKLPGLYTMYLTLKNPRAFREKVRSHMGRFRNRLLTALPKRRSSRGILLESVLLFQDRGILSGR